MKIGAHVSTSGGLDKGIERAAALGAEAVQIFGSAPQMWRAAFPKPEVIESFKQQAEATGLAGSIFLHGVYLVNLATELPVNLQKGVDSLTFYMDLADLIGAQGVIFHVGSHKGSGFDAVLPQITESLGQVLARAKGNANLILENNAGQGANIAGNFPEIRRIMESVGSPRLKVCLDTQHSYASGYDVSTPDGLERAMEEFEHEIGVDNLVAVHANDSKIPLGKPVDRHENIGDGFIGNEGFLNIMKHPAFKDVPFLLEVPGIDRQGPDEENLKRLKDLREQALG